jgi:outer membrane receptor for ferrienterochelin and colicin
MKSDHNDDAFMDEPLSTHLIGLNRWQFYILPKFIEGDFGVKGTLVNSTAGQIDFNPDTDKGDTVRWGANIRMRRLEGWAKVGKVFPDMPWKSTGIQLSAAAHRHNSYFGLRNFDATQQSLYANWIYQSIIGNTNHKFKTGASVQYDNFNEALDSMEFTRTETIPGAYFEYAYSNRELLDVVAGVRADYHNVFGPFITPRLHLRYAVNENTVLRASGGRGQRTPSIIAENIGLLASSRQIIIEGDSTLPGYGLRPEVAWNYGANLTQTFRIAKREGAFSVDFYRTDFVNQVVIDIDRSPQQAVFYNLTGRSFSNSFQAQLDYELLRRFDVRMAYRWYDVRTTFGSELLQKPLQAQHRAFANLAYTTLDKWSFDYTVQWQGAKRIPSTQTNPDEFQLPGYSEPFVLMNAQVSKQFGRWQFYLGGENLLNFRQHHAIISASDPFSPYFDSSLIWGPVFGRNIYGGLRFRIPETTK